MHFWVVDAFTQRPFAGNPAAVVIVDEFPSDAWMHNVAMEMNLSETAFVVRSDHQHAHIRWMTPTTEVPLCGHGTLSAAHVLGGDGPWYFESLSGVLKAWKEDGEWVLDMPSIPIEPLSTPMGLVEALGMTPIFVGRAGAGCVVELGSPNRVRNIQPRGLEELPFLDVVVTASGRAGDPFDFISRCFAPREGIPEDPVTGAAHVKLGPYWAERLGKKRLRAYQASARGGWITVECTDERVLLRGHAVTVLQGTFTPEVWNTRGQISVVRPVEL